MPTYDKTDLQRRMHGAIEALKSDLVGLRTGRASINLLDPVNVEVYGAQMPLNQVATVSAPEPRLLSVQVWDKGNVGPVEKAIRSAGGRDPPACPRPPSPQHSDCSSGWRPRQATGTAGHRGR